MPAVAIIFPAESWIGRLTSNSSFSCSTKGLSVPMAVSSSLSHFWSMAPSGNYCPECKILSHYRPPGLVKTAYALPHEWTMNVDKVRPSTPSYKCIPAVHCVNCFFTALYIYCGRAMPKEKRPAAVALGRKGGLKSRVNLTPEERKRLARKAAARG